MRNDDAFVILGLTFPLWLIAILVCAVLAIAVGYAVATHANECGTTTPVCDCNALDGKPASQYPADCLCACTPSKECSCKERLNDINQRLAYDAHYVAARHQEIAEGKDPDWGTAGPSENVPTPVMTNGGSDKPSAGYSDDDLKPPAVSSGSSAGSSGTPKQPVEVGDIRAGLIPWVDPTFAGSHCTDVVEGICQHEMSHINYMNTHANGQCAGWTNWLMTHFSGKQVSAVKTESEFIAYDDEMNFLTQRRNALQDKCEVNYQCSYSKAMFTDVQDCIRECPCSLAHPCALVKPHCIELNTVTGKPTGNRY
jgi:hypothetical protein